MMTLAEHLANHCVANLKEIAIINKKNSHSIYLYDKKQASRMGYHHADVVVTWKDGPDDWAYEYNPVEIDGVSFYAITGKTIIFYNTF